MGCISSRNVDSVEAQEAEKVVEDAAVAAEAAAARAAPEAAAKVADEALAAKATNGNGSSSPRILSITPTSGKSINFKIDMDAIILQAPERCALSAADANALLEAAPKRGAAAVAILSCPERTFAWQRKTPGYPIVSQVGGLCLFGGNREATDSSAHDTLKRELAEELGDDVAATLTPFARFIVQADAAVMAPRPAYTFVCCAFHASLPVAPSSTEEGKLEVRSLKELQAERFCWGYDEVFSAYLRSAAPEEAFNACAGTPADAPRCEVRRVASDARLGDPWADGEAWR